MKDLFLPVQLYSTQYVAVAEVPVSHTNPLSSVELFILCLFLEARVFVFDLELLTLISLFCLLRRRTTEFTR